MKQSSPQISSEPQASGETSAADMLSDAARVICIMFRKVQYMMLLCVTLCYDVRLFAC